MHWVQQLTRFWNHMQACVEEPDRPLGSALQDNLDLQRSGADCWCHRWLTFLQSTPTETGTLVWLTKLRERDVLDRACEGYLHQAMQTEPSPQPEPASVPAMPAPAVPVPENHSAASHPSAPTNKFA